MIFEFKNFHVCEVMHEPNEIGRNVLLDIATVAVIEEGSRYATSVSTSIKQEFTVTTRSGAVLYFCSYPETIGELMDAFKKYSKQTHREMVEYNFDEAILKHAKASISETVTAVANSALEDLSGICSEAQESVAKINALSLNVNGIDAKIKEACDSTIKLATTVDKLTRKIDGLMD